MNNREEKFSQRFREEKEKLEVWGMYIKEQIETGLQEKHIKLESMIKIPISVRVKDEKSLIQKAFYRGKDYKNPYENITDKVGLRFVVLFVDEIRLIEEVIENINQWEQSKDRNFEDERLKKPTLFDYQSVHYILKNKEIITYKGIEIPAEMTCEVQIRTILQHAYSELTHDTTYKPNKVATPEVHRLIARSMAMIETTDEIFKEVSMKINDVTENNILTELEKNFSEYNSQYSEKEFVEGINILLMDIFNKEIKGIDIEQVKKFLNDNAETIKRDIKAKVKSDKMLFMQPVILLVYYLIENNPYVTYDIWPYDEEIIEAMYITMGKSIENY